MATMVELMVQQACAVMKNAYAPYSKFLVGASVQAEDGTIFSGCNIENSSYNLTNCAERSAIFALISAGKREIKALALTSSGTELCTPCGACRQVIREFAAPDAPIYLCDSHTQQIIVTTNIAELLPRSFGPDFLKQ